MVRMEEAVNLKIAAMVDKLNLFILVIPQFSSVLTSLAWLCITSYIGFS